jgi:hypothetical protein
MLLVGDLDLKALNTSLKEVLKEISAKIRLV